MIALEPLGEGKKYLFVGTKDNQIVLPSARDRSISISACLVQMPHNGDDREETIREYLAEARKCEELAARDSGDQRRAWLELADRFRKLATIIKSSVKLS